MREKHKGEVCELCGEPFTVSHHFIPKSKSIALRYDEKNLILLCKRCHFCIHRTTHKYTQGALIGHLRGLKWIDYINTHNVKSKPLTIKDLEKIVDKYTKLINKFKK